MTPDVVEIAIEPKRQADRERLDFALARLAAEDANFHATTDAESGQTIIKGSGELQLASIADRLIGEFGVGANVGAPQAAYREHLVQPVEVDFTHARQTSGGRDQFARVKISVVPGNTGSGVQFFSEVKNGNIPSDYIPSVEKGMREAADCGSLVGFPIIDFEIHLIDGAYHDEDSSQLAFENAGRGAMREAAQRAGVRLLEPIMKIEVKTSEDSLGDVIGALSQRQSHLQQTGMQGKVQTVTAIAPMAQLFGLEDELASITEGCATVTIAWERYDQCESPGINPDDTFPSAAALRA